MASDAVGDLNVTCEEIAQALVLQQDCRADHWRSADGGVTIGFETGELRPAACTSHLPAAVSIDTLGREPDRNINLDTIS